VGLYARVSTGNQVVAQSIDQQIERLKKAVREKGWQLAEEHTFRDDGRSGATLGRPGLDSLRDAIRAGELDSVLITAPDRLARNYVHQMILLEEFARNGCEAEFLERPMNDDPHDKLLLQIRGAVAEYERTLISDRMRRGRQAKYRAGVLLPWTKPLYGYVWGLDNPRDPAQARLEDYQAHIVQIIFALYTSDGLSLNAIAKHLQQQGIPTPSGKPIWSPSTIRGMLKQVAYTGQVYAQRYQYRAARVRRSATHPIGNPHQSSQELPAQDWIFVASIPPIVSQEQFDLAQSRLVFNKSFARRNNKTHQYLLRALVSCGRCQAACTCRALDKGRYRYYICNGKGRAIHSRRLDKCPTRYAPADQLDELVWQDLLELLQQPHFIAQALEQAHAGFYLPQELQARRAALQQSTARLDNQLERLTDAYLAAVIPLTEYQRRRNDLSQKIHALALQQSQLQAQLDQKREIAALTSSLQDFCKRIRRGLENPSFEQKRQLVELLIDRVIVTDDAVEIRYVFPTSKGSEHVRFCHLRLDYRVNFGLVRQLSPSQQGLRVFSL
jgi:site-specific DNA recombinase